MTRLLRVFFWAVLTIIVLPSFSASAAGMLCEGSIDCPNGMMCKTRPGNKLGHCVGTPVNKASLFCSGSKDCPLGEFCAVRPGHKTGHCVGSTSSLRLICEGSIDCPIGKVCAVQPNQKLGYCKSP